MLKIRVKEVTYNVVENWSEVSLKDAIKLHKIAFRFPDAVKQMYALSISSEYSTKEKEDRIADLDNQLTEKQRIRQLPELYGEVMEVLTSMSIEIIKKVTPLARISFYNKFMLKFVLGVLFFPIDLKPTDRNFFTIGNDKYFYPKTRTFQVGAITVERPFDNVVAQEFADAADLEIAAKNLAGGKFEVAANIMSILCRPLGEEYNEAASLQRVPLFLENLTMNICWEVFFYTIRSFLIANNSIPTSLKEVNPKETLLN